MFERVVERRQDDAFDDIKAATSYAEAVEHSSMTPYRGFLKDLQALDVGDRYLEVGPGPGILAIAIAQENPNVQITGIELSSSTRIRPPS